MIERIYLDLHGVLADYRGACLHAVGMTHEDLGEGQRSYDFIDWMPPAWRRLLAGILGDEDDPDTALCSTDTARVMQFWSMLPALPDAEEVLRRCLAHAPTAILTAPGTHPAGLAGTKVWLDGFLSGIRNAGSAPLDLPLVFAKDKSAMAGPNALLIDDYECNVDAWTVAGGKVLLWPAEWNRNRGKNGLEILGDVFEARLESWAMRQKKTERSRDE